MDALWRGLPFNRILTVNTTKYMELVSEMDKETYLNLIEQFDGFAGEYFELIEEIDSHKEVTLLRLKNLIDDRTKIIVEEAKYNPEEM